MSSRPAWYRYLLALACLVMALGSAPAHAGDGWNTETSHTPAGTADSGTTTMGRNRLPTGTFYQYNPSTWSATADRTFFQKEDGSLAAKDKQGKETSIPTSVVLAKETASAEVWKGEVSSEAGDKASLSVLGVEGIAMGTAGYQNGQVSASGKLIGRAYLLQGSAETRQVGLGDDDLGVHVQAKAWGMAGVEGTLDGTAKVGKEGVALEAKAEVFAGAKANAQIPLTISLCKMKATGRVRGEVSAGAGAKASASFVVDWTTGTAKISAEAAATLGLGAGAGADVVIDLSSLVSDPGAVADCLLDKVKELGEAAVELGGDLVDAAGQALETAGEAIVDAADAVGGALYNGASRAASAVSNVTSSAVRGVASFFGFGGSDPPRAAPAPSRGANAPLRAQTRFVIMVPVQHQAQSGSNRGLSLKAHRQAYPH